MAVRRDTCGLSPNVEHQSMISITLGELSYNMNHDDHSSIRKTYLVYINFFSESKLSLVPRFVITFKIFGCLYTLCHYVVPLEFS